jgi:ribose transport system substrate-binding protein
MRQFDPFFKKPPLLFLLFIALVISGCEQDAHTHTAAPAKDSLKDSDSKRSVALVMKTLTNPFFVEMEKGARKAEKAFGIELIVKTAAQETSIEQQIGIVDGLIRDQVDAIVIAPGDSVELIPVLKKAQDSGIVVVNLDNQLDPDFSRKSKLLNVPFISVDNKVAAYRSAKYIADQVSGPSKALLMEGIRSARNAQMRKLGAMQAFDENANIELAESASANWKIDEAHQLMTQWLERHADVKLVFAANDMMALGVIKSLQEAGREDVLVASFDALEQARKAIRDGVLQASIDQLPEQQGYLGVNYAIRMMGGEDLPATTFINTVLVTRENIQDY